MEELILYFISLAQLSIFLVWGFIGTGLYLKRRRIKNYQRIENVFAEIVGQHLYGSGFKSASVNSLKRAFLAVNVSSAYPRNVQILIDLMIRTQRMLLGRNYHKLKLLYPQLPPYNASIRKVRSPYWYNKARGVREIYEMNQSQFLNEIIPLRNHKNIYVRREAQIALVVFLGWRSLRFLPYLKHNITLWQQIKIVEKLHDLYPEKRVDLLKNAYDIQKGYGKELIMRIIRKFQIVEEVDYIVEQLSFPEHDVREAALYCLSSFTLKPDQVSRLKTLFPGIPNYEQQEATLKLIHAAGTLDVPFLVNLLMHPSDTIKLNSAEALWNGGHKEVVEQFYYAQYNT